VTVDLRVRGTLATVVAVLLLWPLAAAAQTDDGLDLSIRDTRLQPDGTTEVVVSVTGGAAPDVLDVDAFAVTEQGQPVEDLEVEPFLRSADADVVVTAVIDLSGSMRGEPMAVTRAAVAELSRTLIEAGAQVQLIGFAATIDVLTPPSDDLDLVLAAVEDLQAGGPTPLYDAIVRGTEELAAVTGQRNLLVFSDGGDTNSQASLDDAIAAATEVDVPIVIVALDTPDLDPAALDTLAAETDGRVFTAQDLDELEELFSEVARDIASQYLVRYRSDRVAPSTLDLTVAVAAGGSSASTAFAVQNLREEGPTAPRISDASPSLFSNPSFLLAGVIAAFVALLLLFATIFTGSRTRAEKVLDQQLSSYIEHGDLRAGRSGVVAAHFRDRALQLFEASPRPKGFDEKLSRSLEQAGWPLRNGEFLAMVVLSALGAGLLFGVAFNALGGVLVGLIAGWVPFVILQRRRRKRQDQFLGSLPDTLQLMAGSLRAGYGVMQAIDSVAKESSGATAEEFGRVLTEARLGMPLEQALSDMAARIDNDDFRWVVLAINIQREVGGNLAELLDTVANVLREREMLRRQIKVLSAEGRLSAVILVGLPIFLAVYLILVRPEYIGVLVTSGLFGWLLVGGAVFLMLVGIVWIRNLIRIEV
jgi:tight adherence protein B